MEDVPDLPNFSRFHDGYRDDPGSTTSEGNMRTAFSPPTTKTTANIFR